MVWTPQYTLMSRSPEGTQEGEKEKRFGLTIWIIKANDCFQVLADSCVYFLTAIPCQCRPQVWSYFISESCTNVWGNESVNMLPTFENCCQCDVANWHWHYLHLIHIYDVFLLFCSYHLLGRIIQKKSSKLRNTSQRLQISNKLITVAKAATGKQLLIIFCSDNPFLKLLFNFQPKTTAIMYSTFILISTTHL